MSGQSTVASTLARDSIHANPKAGTLTLAKMLHKTHPKVFLTIESARSCLRVQRGACGVQNRLRTPKRIERTAEESETCRRWGACVPTPDPSDWKWYTLPEGPKRWLGICDLHMPYHDRAAVRTALNFADGNCDGVLILGDLGDYYQCSFFDRDPERRQLDQEIPMQREFLASLRRHKGIKRVVYKYGNHEARLDRYVIRAAPAIRKLMKDEIGDTLASWLHLEQLKIDMVPALCPIRHGQLALLHGNEWGRQWASPVNPARGAFMRGGECAMVAHEHRPSQHPEPTMFGRLVTCWSAGCLCSLHPDYRPINKWAHGFFFLDLKRKGEWHIENYRIVDGKPML